MSSLGGRRVVVLSRCARTLFNFRLSLIKALQREGSQVFCLGSGGDGFGERLRESNVDFKAIPVSFKGIDLLGDFWLLVRYFIEFRATRPAVVHAFTIKPAIFGTLGAWLARVPVRIVTITGLGYAFTTARPLVRNLVSALYRISLRRAHLVVFQNPDDLALFVTAGLVDSKKTRLVSGSGVDTQRFSITDLPCSAGRAPAFLMISRLLADKGINEYVAAANVVRRSYPDVAFKVLGGRDSRNPSSLSLDEVTRLGDSGIEWIDEVLDVRPYLAAADVVVLPSYREGLPRVLLEAGAMGRAVIATDVPGCRQAVISGCTGILVPARDARALAEAMERLVLDRDLIARYGRAGREFVEQHFDEKQVIGETIASYELLLNVGGKP